MCSLRSSSSRPFLPTHELPKGTNPKFKKGATAAGGGEGGGTGIYRARPQSHYLEQMALAPGILVL